MYRYVGTRSIFEMQSQYITVFISFDRIYLHTMLVVGTLPCVTCLNMISGDYVRLYVSGSACKYFMLHICRYA